MLTVAVPRDDACRRLKLQQSREGARGVGGRAGARAGRGTAACATAISGWAELGLKENGLNCVQAGCIS